MKILLLFFSMSVTVEAIVEYIKTIIRCQDKKCLVVQFGALAIAIFLCILSGADIYSVLGVRFSLPYLGCILTGVFASRGSNYASEIFSRLQNAGKKNKKKGYVMKHRKNQRPLLDYS